MTTARKLPERIDARTVPRRLDRQAVLASAGRLLEESGPAALTVREVAIRSAISVQGVYTLFGGKPGLCEALFVDGFDTLQSALDAADPRTDPIEAVLGQVDAYRRAALAAPQRYALMFARPIPDFTPTAAARRAAQATFDTLVAVVDAVLSPPASRTPVRPESPTARPASPRARDAALVVWALNHGLVSLELDGLLPDTDGSTLDRAVRDLLASWTAHPGSPSPKADEDGSGPMTSELTH